MSNHSSSKLGPTAWQRLSRCWPLVGALLGAAAHAQLEPVSYDIDPHHTFPSFEADHLGISLWRGKMNRSSGTVTLDKAAGTGTLQLSIDLTSIDFGHEQMNRWATGKDFFDTERHPTATYSGRIVYAEGRPARVEGSLTMRGVTRPVPIQIKSFRCIPHPMIKRELCGADAYASFNRDDFGLDAGKLYGFKMNVDLRIQVEALARE
jgi:polyisoprenoid-binding protein YceI